MTRLETVSYTHLRAHETLMNLVCRLLLEKNLFLIIRRPTRSTRKESSAASDVYKRQNLCGRGDKDVFAVAEHFTVEL